MLNTEFKYPSLSRWKKARLLRFATEVLTAGQQMTGANTNILHHTLHQLPRHIYKSHYPNGDRIDKTTGAQYFYHCHRENFEQSEHGHFHCFMRYKNIPRYIKPTLPPDAKNDSPMTHLVAIAMNLYGQPIRLFTVNRWVSSDIWYGPTHTANLVKRFKFTLNDDPHWQILDQWIAGILQLFAPQIIWLQHARDQRLAMETIDHPDKNTYEDIALEELSTIAIDLNQQIQWIIG